MRYIKLNLKKFSLREEQLHAIESIDKYLIKYFDNKIQDKSSLICMPTGSGKTGVFALVARAFKHNDKPGVLIVSPRIKITKQIYEETFSNFFTKLQQSIPLNRLLKEGVLVRKDKTVLKSDYSNKVFFMTIQMFQCIWNGANNGNYESIKIINLLQQNIGLLIVDEGHYEPAPKWAECIRDFRQSAKIIFSATPYRNDFQMFNVSKEDVFFLSYHKALEHKYVRSVKLLPSNNENNAKDFVKQVISNYKHLLNKNNISINSKIIIRCDSAKSIRLIAKSLNCYNISYIAIHESFKDKKSYFVSTVPDNIEQHPAQVWIHQFKLMEGVDAPSFQFIAHFEIHKNTRSIIQEFGRGLRRKNIDLLNDAFLYYMDNANGKTFHKWEQYLKFDKYLEENNNAILFKIEDNLDMFVSSLPDLYYISGQIKEIFKFSTIDIKTDILLPLSCRVFLNKETNYSLAVDQIVKELRKHNRLPSICFLEHNEFCIIHTGLKPSKYFPNHLYPENDIEIIYILGLKNGCYVYDKTKISDGILIKNDMVRDIDIKSLQKLFHNSSKSIVNEITLEHMGIERRAIRQKNLIASHNLIEVPVSINDFSYACKKISGYCFSNQRYIKRSVGFNKSKVLQDSTYNYFLDQYKEWINNLEYLLFRKGKILPYFKRFSDDCPPQNELVPINIYLHMNDFAENFECRAKHESNIINKFNSKVVSNHFKINLDGKCYQFKIVNNNTKFRITSVEFDKDFVQKNAQTIVSATNYFNENQNFTLMFLNSTIIYSLKHYFEPKIKIGKKFDENQFNILSLLEVEENLDTVIGEKNAKNNIWCRDSIFGLISNFRLHNREIQKKNVKYLICDDLSTEVADFILCTNNKLIFIHAKYGFGSKCSGSKLQDVCSQANKNISYLSPFNQLEPKHLNRWNNKWELNGSSIARIICSRDNVTTPKQIWSDLRQIICDPHKEKEVWLVLGKLLSKQELSNQLQHSTQFTAEALHVCIQLMNCAEVVNSVGAKLRVFCGK